jgi:hypothetical protein
MQSAEVRPEESGDSDRLRHMYLENGCRADHAWVVRLRRGMVVNPEGSEGDGG